MDAAVGWVGVAMGALSLGSTIYSKFNDRKVAADKMEHEEKMRALELDAAAKDKRITDVEERLAECTEQHRASERDRLALHAELEDSRRDRAQLRAVVERLERGQGPRTPR